MLHLLFHHERFRNYCIGSKNKEQVIAFLQVGELNTIRFVTAQKGFTGVVSDHEVPIVEVACDVQVVIGGIRMNLEVVVMD